MGQHLKPLTNGQERTGGTSHLGPLPALSFDFICFLDGCFLFPLLFCPALRPRYCTSIEAAGFDCSIVEQELQSLATAFGDRFMMMEVHVASRDRYLDILVSEGPVGIQSLPTTSLSLVPPAVA